MQMLAPNRDGRHQLLSCEQDSSSHLARMNPSHVLALQRPRSAAAICRRWAATGNSVSHSVDSLGLNPVVGCAAGSWDGPVGCGAGALIGTLTDAVAVGAALSTSGDADKSEDASRDLVGRKN